MVARNARPLDRDDREAALAALYDEVHARHMFPFWATAMDVAHDEIRRLTKTARALPYKWSFKVDIEPLLYRSAELVSMADSERRSLIVASCATASTSVSQPIATGAPWKFPPDTISSASAKTIGLSVAAFISMVSRCRTHASASRAAPWTCGAHRME